MFPYLLLVFQISSKLKWYKSDKKGPFLLSIQYKQPELKHDNLQIQSLVCAFCTTHHIPGWAPTAWSCWLRAGPFSSAGRPWNQKRGEHGHSLEQETALLFPAWSSLSWLLLHAASSWRVISGGCYLQTVRGNWLESPSTPPLTTWQNGSEATTTFVSGDLMLENSSSKRINQCMLNNNAAHGDRSESAEWNLRNICRPVVLDRMLPGRQENIFTKRLSYVDIWRCFQKGLRSNLASDHVMRGLWEKNDSEAKLQSHSDVDNVARRQDVFSFLSAVSHNVSCGLSYTQSHTLPQCLCNRFLAVWVTTFHLLPVWELS